MAALTRDFPQAHSATRQSRRAFLHQGALILAGGALLARPLAAAEETAPAARVGLLTDCHYADLAEAGTRFYRRSLTKVREAVDKFNSVEAQAVVELGDFIDAGGDRSEEIRFLHAIEAEFARVRGARHYVLGNHCVYTLTKSEFLDNCAARESYYSFDLSGFHCVVLDACFRPDGVPYGRKNFKWNESHLPDEELAWLARDLQSHKAPTVVFIHQRLDVQPPHGVGNAAVVRKLFEDSGRVVAVFQGHSHQNAHQLIGGVHYCTLRAVVDGPLDSDNGYALLDLFEDGSLRLTGYRQQTTYDWKSPS